MNTRLNSYEWFINGFTMYNPIPDIVTQIKPSLQKYSIILIIDPNCKDVQDLIPKLIKTLYQCDIVDFSTFYTNKEELPIILNGKMLEIEKVPTIIFKKNKVEQFRITEKLLHSSNVENELKWILSQLQN